MTPKVSTTSALQQVSSRPAENRKQNERGVLAVGAVPLVVLCVAGDWVELGGNALQVKASAAGAIADGQVAPKAAHRAWHAFQFEIKSVLETCFSVASVDAHILVLSSSSACMHGKILKGIWSAIG